MLNLAVQIEYFARQEEMWFDRREDEDGIDGDL